MMRTISLLSCSYMGVTCPAQFVQDSSSCFSVADCVVQMRCNVVRYSNCVAYVCCAVCVAIGSCVCSLNRFQSVSNCVAVEYWAFLILSFCLGAKKCQLMCTIVIFNDVSSNSWRWLLAVAKIKYNKQTTTI